MSSKVYNADHSLRVENSIMKKLDMSDNSVNKLKLSRMLRKKELKNLSETIGNSGETFDFINNSEEGKIVRIFYMKMKQRMRWLKVIANISFIPKATS